LQENQKPHKEGEKTMTKHIAATIKIAVKDKDATDGILERISDLGFDHGAENDGSDLVYAMEGDNLDKLRERAVAFRRALQEFFKVTKISRSALDIRYREETT
jgi:hypothetical protein